jgi:hypothetical protein
VFEIPVDGEMVISHSGLRDEPMREHQKEKQKDFLSKVRKAAKGELTTQLRNAKYKVPVSYKRLPALWF